MSVTYKLESFEGPLDLLLHLIDKNEVDIYDIPISDITDQYMEYIQSMQAFELGLASEFLVMAATLLAIKSKMLLPKPPVLPFEEEEAEEIDPRAELVERLIEYRKYKEIAEHLREQELTRSMIFSREPSDLTPYANQIQDNPVRDLHIADLVIAFQKVLRRSVRRETVTKIKRDEISVRDRVYDVLSWLEQRDGKLLFSTIISDQHSRDEIVVTFLALLELMKMKKITCYQHRTFEDIVIRLRDGEEAAANELSTDEIDY